MSNIAPAKKGLHIIGYGRPFKFNAWRQRHWDRGLLFGALLHIHWREVRPQGRVKQRTDPGRPLRLRREVLHPIQSAGKTLIPEILRWRGADRASRPQRLPPCDRKSTLFELNDRGEWVNAGHGAQRFGSARDAEIWDTWSRALAQKYDAKDAMRVWKSFQSKRGND